MPNVVIENVNNGSAGIPAISAMHSTGRKKKVRAVRGLLPALRSPVECWPQLGAVSFLIKLIGSFGRDDVKTCQNNYIIENM